MAPTAATPSYVALGDSFTAGPLILNHQLNPLGCLRSDRNYPHVAAPSIGLRLARCELQRRRHARRAVPPNANGMAATARVVVAAVQAG